MDRGERNARVVVRYQGSGVAPDDTEAIFKPYVQAGPDRGGIGLGLYVSRGLARAQGGELSVQPARDVGSEFVLELPIDALVALSSPAGARSPAGPESRMPSSRITGDCRAGSSPRPR